MVREGYKKTEVGEIPEDWEVKNLEEIVKLIDGDRSTNYPSQSELVNEGILFLSTSNIKNSKLIYKECRFITEEKFSALRKGKLQNNDLIITLRGSIGNVAKFSDKEYKTGFINAQMMILRGNKINSDYLLNLLISEKYQTKINVISSGSAQPQLTKKDLSSLKVIIPPLKEQEKIAEILSTLDCQINATDKLIEKTKQLKKGLMQKLLTKGIGHTEFKKTEVGEIPVEWEVNFIDEVAKRYSGHTPNKKKCIYWNGKIPWISLKDTQKLDNRYIHKTEDYTTEEGINNSSAVLLPKGTVVISRDATIGKIGIMASKMATSQHFINYVCGERLNNLYLYYYFMYNKLLFEKIAIGSTIKTIGLNFFKNLKIVVPSIKEQEKIAEIISSVDTQVEKYQNKKLKLEHLKKGLMQQLLTGKIRII